MESSRRRRKRVKESKIGKERRKGNKRRTKEISLW